MKPMSQDEKEFRRDLVAILPRLRRFALALAGNRDAAEDLLQSAVERALRKWEQFEKGRRLDSWVFKLMQNLWYDTRRASVALPVFTIEALDVVGEDGREVVEMRDELRAVRSAFAALPPEQRSVVALVILEGYSYAEAAETLEVPIGTIMSRLSRARTAMTAIAPRLPGVVTPLRKEL